MTSQLNWQWVNAPMTNQDTQLCPSNSANLLLAECPLLRIKLSRALFCTPDECHRALEEVIKFLVLAVENANHPVTPSARVDVAWHEFILFTRTYSKFCQEKLGRMVHHEPSIDHDSNSKQYATTLIHYRQRFGEPPTEYWGGPQVQSTTTSSAFCGSCEADL